MSRPIILNGKFLAGPATGVQRVAAEMIRALDAIERDRFPSSNAIDLKLIIPPGSRLASLDLRTIPISRVGYFKGTRWEQLDLPRLAGGSLIVNLANVGPVLISNAITMIHDAQTFSCPASYSRAFRAWYGLVQPTLGKRNRRILTVSEFSKQQLAHYGIAPKEKIDVIHNGVDHMARVQSDPSAAIQLKPRGYVLGPASTQAHKNIGTLLRAFEDTRLQGVDLILFGSATAEDLQKINGKPLPRNVKVIGSISDGVLKGLMEQALALAFPSRTEGFGLPPLEAMFVGCPAIVAPCGALPEVCGDAAIYADADNSREWVDKILTLAQDFEYWHRRSKAAKAQASKFCWQKSAMRLLEIIKQYQ